MGSTGGHGPADSRATTPDLDIAVIGAGISGVNMAYHIQNKLAKGTRYAIFEGRGTIGGTWDLFRYPGIRSDSDIVSFGFQWAHWTGTKTLGQGADIRNYMERAAKDHGIYQNIRFHHKVVSADWRSEHNHWVLTVTTPDDDGDEKPRTFTARYVVLGTGYYDYKQPLKTTIPGIDSFEGKVIHPQFWPEDYDYSGKNVVIIGSGATAVTLLPSMAERASHVTMLQRSPTYLFALPVQDPFGLFVRTWLPLAWAARLMRYYNITRTYLLYWFCQAYPKQSIAFIRKRTVGLLPPEVKWDPHFKPRYNPWEQRLCVTPGGDFFETLRSGKGSVVTDTIEQVTAKEIKLSSGQTLHPDVIITATGLKVQFAGGITMKIDGEDVDVSEKLVWKTAMIQDLPNLFYMLGYTNASWTLGAEVTAALVVRLLNKMAARREKVVVPRLDEAESKGMERTTMFDLSATYLKLARDALPKGGSGQWAPRTQYFADMYRAWWGDVSTNLEFK